MSCSQVYAQKMWTKAYEMGISMSGVAQEREAAAHSMPGGLGRRYPPSISVVRSPLDRQSNPEGPVPVAES